MNKKIHVRAFAALQAILFSLLGLVAGVIYSFGGLIVDSLVTMGWLGSPDSGGLSAGTVLAFGALVGMPLVFAVVGYVTGLVEALLFNMTAKWIKGSVLNIKQDKQ